ncbi:hypothetical protein BGZ80_011733 [Entomortierella chlamydospora]|uniref:HCP-like protein n=1 Tax=Entomortierella chlamydospora TaxID=101097 RepID=A0A9P6SZE0_9FUNG|nr:hypothetical protein BGZ80_011733 [Entomortierella chlamydospora]
MTSSTQVAPIQSLRAVYRDSVSGAIVPLPTIVNFRTRFDCKAGEYIILWNDVKTVFKNPMHVMHEDVAVPFLADEDFDFEPLRISAYPGVTLNVVIEAPETGVESQRVQISPMVSPTSSTDPPLSSYNGVPQNLERPSKDKSHSLASSITQDSQPDADPNIAKDNLGNHSQPTVEHDNGPSVDGLEDGQEQGKSGVDEYYVRGLSYYKGKDIPKDYQKARDFFLLAANQGHIGAQYILGCMYQNGYGVTRDCIEAMEWYEMSAEQGCANSQYSLGQMYDCGYGIGKDRYKAMEWYQRSANQGYAMAQFCLGDLYYTCEDIINYPKALEWYQKSADQGNAKAQNGLGNLYFNGQGVTYDFFKGLKWYRKSAVQGYSAAQCKLADIFYNGIGVTTDYAKALELYQKAAEQGHARAQCALGDLYYRGHGTAVNYTKASGLYLRSAAQGNSAAQYKIGLAYCEVDNDPSKAVEWFQRAAELKNTDAMGALGSMYETGNGVAKDPLMALRWRSAASAIVGL